jgi:hypothetical protein
MGLTVLLGGGSSHGVGGEVDAGVSSSSEGAEVLVPVAWIQW